MNPSKGAGEFNMAEYEIEIAGIKRKLPLYKVDDDVQIAAFILFGDVEITKAAATELLSKAPEFDLILTAEAKSIPLVYEMSRQSENKDYVVARKGKKVYMTEPLDVTVESITTQKEQHLYLGQEDIDKLKGKNILIVDDVISTGESLKALEKIANEADANVTAKMSILVEGDAIDRDDVISLSKLYLFDGEGNIKG